MSRHLVASLKLFMLTFGLLVGSLKVMAAEKQILIITHANEAPYSDVIAGFKKQQKNANFIQILADNTGIAAKITAYQPHLIFAVGGDAAELAVQNSKTIPIVATLLLKSAVFKASNLTGVTLAYPLLVQIQWLKKFFPEQNKIAILFNPDENAKTVDELSNIAVRSGLELTTIPVESPKQLPFALEQLAKNVQILFAIPDNVAMSPKTAKEVLLASFRNRVPLVGLSDNWVKSGALYALSWDYNDLGQQCALQSQRLLNGEPVQNVAPETPRKITYTINAKIAEHMDIVLPASLLQNAKLIFN